MPRYRTRRGVAIRSEAMGDEVNLRTRFGLEIPHNIGRLDDRCSACGAFRWKIERRVKDANLLSSTYGNCCQHGAVELPLRYFAEDIGHNVPPFYYALLTRQDNIAVLFRSQIRKYNNAMSFTSLGATIDRSVMGQRGVNVFRISGQLSHNIGSLMPLPGNHPGFAQIFVYGGGDHAEAQFRNRHFNDELDPQILRLFQHFMDLHNPYTQVFRSAAAICHDGDPRSLRINTITAPGRDHRRYNRPTANEVAAIIEGNGQIGARQRDIILERQTGDKQRISELHTAYFALRYPLLFPYGSQSWHENFVNPTEERPNGEVTNLEWFAYLLFQRDTFSIILASGRLFQEFAVDMYVCVEHSRLQFIRFHQTELRAELYNGAVEALNNETDDEVVGRRVILPSSFIGGPRHMQQLYQDAMSLVAEFGHPSLFLTMTANPQWSEILESLEPGQLPEDRPDLVARVFHAKFHSLLDDVTKQERLGKCLAYVYTVEFQKRGLPHVHLILFLDPINKPTTPEQIDCLISAQLPNPVTEAELFNLVTTSMLHGPCRNYKCWTGSECKLKYPRPFREVTELAEDAYPTYKRPNNGRHFIKGQDHFDNRHVVPHNKFLTLKYECHINVEVAASIRAIKYLFKYILKGHDRTMATVDDPNQDEILTYVNARFLSAIEAIWRLLKFELSGRSPAVQRLSLHLEGGQTVYFYDEAGLRRAIETGRAERTTLTEYFRLCAANAPLRGSDLTIRSLRYQEVPKFFTWNLRTKRLEPRRNSLMSVGRVYFANVKRGDIYYLRLLLSHIAGPTSFEDLRTVEGVRLNSFREAANRLGLLLNDQHYHNSLTEAAVWQTGRQLRHMLAIILIHSSPANPQALWADHIHNLTDDCAYTIRQLNPRAQPTDQQVHNYGLFLLGKVVEAMETTLEDLGMPRVDQQLLLDLELPNEVGPDRINSVTADESAAKYTAMLNVMTNEQLRVVVPICEAILNAQPYLAFLDGPGGTGKTFVLNCVLHYCNANQIGFEAVSAAGIAALLLLHGRTAHSAFKIPIPVHDDSICGIFAGGGERVLSAKFIVWDEVAMQHKYAIESVDRTLRELTGIDLPFGGKVVLFAGDFRQTLPIIRRGNLMEQAQATLKGSYLWHAVQRFALTVNIRLGGISANPNPANVAFARWLLELGSGQLQQDHIASAALNYCNVTIVRPPSSYDEQLLEAEYNGVTELILQRNWVELTAFYSDRCLITPLNATVNLVNRQIMNRLPGTAYTSTSIDLMDESFVDPVTADVLNTFNFPGFPAHKLKLKVGASVMVMRNLSLANGLCNGTRLLITDYSSNALQCRILTGNSKGKSISLPKIKLKHNGNEDCPIPFYRYQFPITVAFCMTINKSQGQSLERVTVLLPKPVFSHGQLYVALSRCTNASNVTVCITSNTNVPATTNIVFHPVLHN